jgi:Heparinase II/III-like protein/Heparinase II/III N-terminus
MNQLEPGYSPPQSGNSLTAECFQITESCDAERDEFVAGVPKASAHPWSAFLRYARTIRHLQPLQIYSRFRPRPSVRNVRKVARLRAVPGGWLQPVVKLPAQTGPNRFRFLNQEREIATWNDDSIPRLWLYNLHYFEYVNKELVIRWMAENPVGQGIGWDPYPTSLRIANWCKWVLSGTHTEPDVYDSIATQAAWLERCIERHLMANHLLANAKALLFAGSVLECADADRWCKTALQIYREQLPEQILRDGAHMERSPMYHGIILEDLLDVCNLNRALDRPIPEFPRYASRMLGWLDKMTHPDGEISFFNDATFGIAPSLSALEAYARGLAVRPTARPLSESGYVRLENDKVVIIFDAGPIGPDYQPGHGHADTLSFELSDRGHRVFVNSGTSTYESNSVRAFERGTAAHNTVRIDGVDQSELWAAFRVARRARPFDIRTDNFSFVEAAHDGYHRLRPKVTHRRRVDLDGGVVTVTDSLEGSGQHNIELFFHLAPHAKPELHLDPKLSHSVLSSGYSTGFNARVPNRMVLGCWFGQCPVQFLTRIDLS